MKHHAYLLPVSLLAVAWLSSCTPEPYGSYSFTRQPGQMPQQQVQDEQAVLLQEVVTVPYDGSNPLLIPNKNAPGYINPYPAGSYEHFVAKPAYPKTSAVFCNEPLLQSANTENTRIIICLPQQRARMYVNGRVAYDWPVSTGTDGHETPPGAYRILDRETNHKSNRYGKFVNASGRVVSSNADTSKGTPEGLTFRPAGMPHWNRLTPDGVGIHGGKVVPGRRLSHGCIRTPYDVAAKLFNYTKRGMAVYVTSGVEDYAKGGAVRPQDVKYRPKVGNDYTDY
ncbi:MAG: L,D-transpeptidase family protein [Akkermansia muciniphila]|nr:L,D-transpeptidase family protein [Akkermansia muciniphila]